MTTTTSRPLAVCIFADEKTTTPKKVGELPWLAIIQAHRHRRTRPGKSGLMLGGYKTNGPRANDNVPFRSLIQLDIDTKGDKDKATGRILNVTRRAPTLNDVRPGLPNTNGLQRLPIRMSRDVASSSIASSCCPIETFCPRSVGLCLRRWTT